MAHLLYRLGRAAFRHRRIVVAGWILAFVAAMVGAATLSGKTQDSFDLPGLESTDAYTLIKDRTPDAAPDGATARVVFQAPEGETLTSGANRQAVEESLAGIKTDHVVAISDPYQTGTVSEDGRTAYSTVNYDRSSIELAQADKDALESSESPAEDAGLTVAIGGDALQEMPEQGVGELIGIAIAAVVLIITFGSLIAAGMPLLSAIIGVGIGVGGITIATGFMDLGSSTVTLASMLGLAVAIDYSLFIVSRYRHEVSTGRDLEEAAGRAVATAGSAVVFAGITVAIALAGLAVVNIRFLTEMGLAAVVTVLMSVVIALTLLPALLGFAGRRIMSSRFKFLHKRDPERRDPERKTMGLRWAQFVTRNKIAVIIGGLVIAAVASIPVASMQLALPDDGTQREGTGPRQAYDMISDAFGPGANGPLMVVVDTANASNPEQAVNQVTTAVSDVKTDIQTVIPAAPVEPQGGGQQAQQAYQQQVQAYQNQLQQAQYALVTVVPKSGPSSADTTQLVHDIRDALKPVQAETGAATYVTGQTAVGVDVSQKLADVFPLYLGLVVGLAFILLMVLFRSILVPLKAVLGFLLTVGISLGATVAVFQWGWAAEVFGIDKTGPIMAMMPILIVGILFGLAMDYEVFLVSRMREEFHHGAEATQAVVTGFRHGARVVTAAAIIMIGVFLGFMTSGEIMMITIAFSLAFGILADAFLVRMTLVPAVMAVAGKAIWWLPSWLQRILPTIDVDGDSLDAEESKPREREVALSD